MFCIDVSGIRACSFFLALSLSGFGRREVLFSFLAVWEALVLVLLRPGGIQQWSHLWLFFDGRLLIPNSISLYIIGLCRFPIFSWFSLGRLYVSTISPSLLSYLICWCVTGHSSVLWSLCFYGIWRIASSFISDLFRFSFFSLVSSRFVNFVYLFKTEPMLWFILLWPLSSPSSYWLWAQFVLLLDPWGAMLGCLLGIFLPFWYRNLF